MAHRPSSLRFRKAGVYLGKRRVAPAIRYTARGTRHWNDTKVAKIRFCSSDGRTLTEQFDLADFQPRNRHRVVDTLANRGYEWPTNPRASDLLDELIKQPPTRKFTIVNAPGWHDGSYVTAHWCVTPPGTAPYRLDPDSGAHIALFSLGTDREIWTKGIKKPATSRRENTES